MVLVGRYAAALNAGEFVLAGDTCLLVRACLVLVAGWFVVLVGRYAATLNAGEFVLAGSCWLLVRAGCWLVLVAGW